jgi:hypothetical protein
MTVVRSRWKLRAMPEPVASARLDLVRHGVAVVLWGPPPIVLLASGLVDVAPVTRGAIWALALLWAGAACVTNACRSGRLHCYITGPFFLLLAAASLLHGFGILPLGTHGWLWIGAVFGLGTPALIFVPERLWGRYSNGHQEHRC